jgi:photosystem II stability/assembly factor-like uncharacterized protein
VTSLRRRRASFVVFAALVGCGLATAASMGGRAVEARTGERWGPSHGPDGGPAFAVAVAPSAPQDVYLGTGRGVFRSTDGGRSWTSAWPEPPASASWFPGVTALEVDPSSPATVYAGRNSRWAGGMSYGQPVVKTTDGGRTWHALELRGQPIAITPTAVYAATGGPRGSRLVRSTDAGRSWHPADAGLPSSYVWGLAFDPSAPATLYAAMGTHGVFTSDDGGGRWRSVGIPRRYGEVTAIAVDPLHPETVYAATDAGIAVSRDAGRSWRVLNGSIGNRGRARWVMQVTALLVDPGDTQTLYATTRCAGVLESTDGGRSWSAANAGLEPGCPWAYALALDPRAPQRVYAADPTRGVVESDDGAAHWHAANKGLSLADVWSLAVAPRALYAGAGALGLFESRDGGAHWRPLATGLDAVYAVAVDPADPENVLAAGSTTEERDQPSGPPIAASSDGGRTWTRPAFAGRYPNVVAIDGLTAYAGSAGGYGVFGTADGGRGWRALGPPGVVYVQALAVEPGNPDVVYVGADGRTRGLYESSDGGRTWHRASALDVDVTAVALDPESPSTVYVATNGGEGGVFRSTDGGTTWQKEDAGLHQRVKVRRKWADPTVPVTALVVDPADSARLYAATDQGVYRSTDAGESWHPLDAGLSDRSVDALAVDPTGRTVYAGTGTGGVVSLGRAR